MIKKLVPFGTMVLAIWLLLTACAPKVTANGDEYTISLEKGAFGVIGASEVITEWESEDTCTEQDTYKGKGYALVCISPNLVVLVTEGTISVQYYDENAIPISIPAIK